MNKKQSGIIVALLVLIVFASYLASKINSPLYDASADLNSDKSTVSMNEVKSGDSNFFVEQKITRDNKNSKAYQTLQTLIDDESASKENREKASTQYRELAMRTEKATDIESKLKGKGFDDVICYIDGNKVKVFVKTSKDLTQDQIRLIKDEVLSSTNIKDVEITQKK